MRDPVTDEPVAHDPAPPLTLIGASGHFFELALDRQGCVYLTAEQWATVQRIEAKLDRLIQALRAGAIGQWGNG